jgi:hypothetical protein
MEIDKYTVQAMDTIIDYMYDDEADDYEESDKPKGHVFESVKLVADWIKNNREETKRCPKCDSTMTYAGHDLFVCDNESCGYNLDV